MRNMEKYFTVSSNGVFDRYRYYTLITSMFSHQTLYHVGANMLTFWFFAPEVFAILGAKNFLVLYLGGGVVSSLCHILWPNIVPKWFPSLYSPSKYTPALGASGAINSIIVYSILTFPTRIILINFILPMPAALAGILFMTYDLYGLYQGGGNVGNAAHLGGAAFGAIYFLRRRFRIF